MNSDSHDGGAMRRAACEGVFDHSSTCKIQALILEWMCPHMSMEA